MWVPFVPWWMNLLFYASTSVTIYMIACEAEHPRSRLAFIPIVNFWLLCEMIDGPPWLIIVLCMPVIGHLFQIPAWMQLAEHADKPAYLGILMIVPFLNIAVAWYMVFYEPAEIRT